MAETGKRIALVTGGSRGIGRAIALRLASEGSHVVVNYTKNEPAAREVVAAIEKSGGCASISGFDVSDFDAVQKKVEGKEITLTEQPETGAQVIDLMEALRASLEKKPARKVQAEKPAARKSAKK